MIVELAGVRRRPAAARAARTRVPRRRAPTGASTQGDPRGSGAAGGGRRRRSPEIGERRRRIRHDRRRLPRTEERERRHRRVGHVVDAVDARAEAPRRGRAQRELLIERARAAGARRAGRLQRARRRRAARRRDTEWLFRSPPVRLISAMSASTDVCESPSMASRRSRNGCSGRSTGLKSSGARSISERSREVIASDRPGWACSTRLGRARAAARRRRCATGGACCPRRAHACAETTGPRARRARAPAAADVD